MASLAPKANKICFRMKNAMAVHTIENIIRSRNALATYLDASFLLPSPSFIPISGAPPTPIRVAKDKIIVTIGAQTPIAVSAVSPTTGIWLTNIRSVML